MWRRTAMPPASGKIKSARRCSRNFTAPMARLPLNKWLLDLGAAALDQNKQNDYYEYTSNNPNDRGVIHFVSSFLQ
jgi:hypothetical protein